MSVQSVYFSDNYCVTTKDKDTDSDLNKYPMFSITKSGYKFRDEDIGGYIKGEVEDVVHGFLFLNKCSFQNGNSYEDTAMLWKCPMNAMENNSTTIDKKKVSNYIDSIIAKYKLKCGAVVVPFVHMEELKKVFRNSTPVYSNIEAFIQMKNIYEDTVFYVVDEYDMYRVDYMDGRIAPNCYGFCGNIMSVISCICRDMIEKMRDSFISTGIRTKSIEYKKICKKLYFIVLMKLIEENNDSGKMNLDCLFGTQDLELGIKKDGEVITYKLDCNSANEICKSWIDKFINDVKLYISKDMGDSDIKYYIIGDFAHLLYNAEFNRNNIVDPKCIEYFSKGGASLFKRANHSDFHSFMSTIYGM